MRTIIAAAAIAVGALVAAPGPATAAGPDMEITEAEAEAGALAFAVHVGSYKMPGNAPRDWWTLADFWPGVLYFKRMTKVVDIPGKGMFTRLYLVGDPALAPVLCRELKKRAKYCAIHDLRAGAGVTLHDGEAAAR